jgi:heme/copper-type cytochrome/quinol oxidase subunit 1
MNRIRRICRFLADLPKRAAVLLASAAAAPAVLATSPPLPPGWNKHPPLPAHTHPAATGGMPGWQITLIAAAAVLLAAALAVTVYRMRAARRRVTTSAA